MSRVFQRIFGAAVFSAAVLSFVQAEPVAEPKTATVAPGVSVAECEAFGRQLADDFNAGNLDAFFGRLDKPAFIKSVFEGFELPNAEREKYERQFAADVVAELSSKMQQFKTAKYLRVQELAEGRRVVLRFTVGDLAMTYVAFFVGKDSSGKACWTDAFGYGTAETMSDGLRRFLLFVSQGRLAAPRNLTEAAIYSNGRYYVKKLTRFQQLLEKGNYDGALQQAESLPDELRTAKFLLGLRVQAAQKLGDEVYLKAVETWEEAHPGDASLNLIAIDGHLLRKNYSDAVRCVDNLANQLKGTDGRLCFVKAYALAEDRLIGAARAAAEEGVRVEPDLPENYTALLKFALDAGDFPEAVKILQAVEKNIPDTDPKRLIPEAKTSGEFFKSDEFRAWMKTRFSS